MVCIASAIAGATSQDLKTGFLVGATPRRQQIALLIGVAVSSLAVGGTLILMNVGLSQYKPMQIALDINNCPRALRSSPTIILTKGRTYELVNSLGLARDPRRKISLRSLGRKQIEVQWVQGIGSEQAAAPQARLMATVISGILNQRLPWRLVFLGVFLVIAVELLGIRSLPFAVGSYLRSPRRWPCLPEGMVRWLAERGAEKKAETEGAVHGESSEVSPGSLYASGLIAAGGVFGLLAIILNLAQDSELSRHVPHWLMVVLRLPWPESLFNGWGARHMPHLREAPLLGVVLFVALAVSLFVSARKRLEN